MARNRHSDNTREAAKNHLQLSSANNKFGLKTFACRAPKLWNDLPLELLEIAEVTKILHLRGRLSFQKRVNCSNVSFSCVVN